MLRPTAPILEGVNHDTACVLSAMHQQSDMLAVHSECLAAYMSVQNKQIEASVLSSSKALVAVQDVQKSAEGNEKRVNALFDQLEFHCELREFVMCNSG